MKFSRVDRIGGFVVVFFLPPDFSARKEKASLRDVRINCQCGAEASSTLILVLELVLSYGSLCIRVYAMIRRSVSVGSSVCLYIPYDLRDIPDLMPNLTRLGMPCVVRFYFFFFSSTVNPTSLFLPLAFFSLPSCQVKAFMSPRKIPGRAAFEEAAPRQLHRLAVFVTARFGHPIRSYCRA